MTTATTDWMPLCVVAYAVHDLIPVPLLSIC